MSSHNCYDFSQSIFCERTNRKYRAEKCFPGPRHFHARARFRDVGRDSVSLGYRFRLRADQIWRAIEAGAPGSRATPLPICTLLPAAIVRAVRCHLANALSRLTNPTQSPPKNPEKRGGKRNKRGRLSDRGKQKKSNIYFSTRRGQSAM